jgi:hypothetical protein
LAIWRPRTLKARLGIGFAAALLIAVAVYVAATEHLWVRVKWHDQDRLPYTYVDENVLAEAYGGLDRDDVPRDARTGQGVRWPKIGCHFLVGDVIVVNSGLREVSGCEVRFEVVGTDGIVYGGAWDYSPPGRLESGWGRYLEYAGLKPLTVLPTMVYGGGVSGNVIFELPKGVGPKKLRLKRATGKGG